MYYFRQNNWRNGKCKLYLITVNYASSIFQLRSVFGFANISSKGDVVLVAVAELIVDACVHVLKKKRF